MERLNRTLSLKDHTHSRVGVSEGVTKIVEATSGAVGKDVYHFGSLIVQDFHHPKVHIRVGPRRIGHGGCHGPTLRREAQDFVHWTLDATFGDEVGDGFGKVGTSSVAVPREKGNFNSRRIPDPYRVQYCHGRQDLALHGFHKAPFTRRRRGFADTGSGVRLVDWCERSRGRTAHGRIRKGDGRRRPAARMMRWHCPHCIRRGFVATGAGFLLGV